MKKFHGRVGLQQRVLPSYRVPFFNRLGESCSGGLGVFAGRPRRNEGIAVADHLGEAEYVRAQNIHLLGGGAYICLQPGLLSWVKELDPEVLIVEANPRYLTSRAVIRWMTRRERPVLGWGLGSPVPMGLLGGFRLGVRSRFLSNFSGLIAYSSLGAEQYRALGFPSDRVFVAPNAVAHASYDLPDRPPIAGRDPRILFVGRLQRRKRVDLLLKACAELGSNPHLWIVGDGPARRELEQQASSVYPKASFQGALQGSALREAFEKADIFVLPGTGGLAVQEAMAHGLPVIVAQGDGTQADLVADGNGWLVPPDDQSSLVEALQEAFSDLSRLRQLGEKSHQLVRERFNIDVMTRVFVTALKAVTGRA